MLCGEDAGVQEHKADDEPEHPLGLAHQPRLSAHAPVPPAQSVDIKTGFDHYSRCFIHCQRSGSNCTEQDVKNRFLGA
jgi:hypothetical protein